MRPSLITKQENCGKLSEQLAQKKISGLYAEEQQYAVSDSVFDEFSFLYSNIDKYSYIIKYIII